MQNVWAYVNESTGKLVWTHTGHPAVFKSRNKARWARQRGLVSTNTKLVKYQQV